MIKKLIFVTAFVFLLLNTKALAAPVDEQSTVLKTDEIEQSLTDEAKGIMEDESITNGIDSERVANKLFSWMKSNLLGIFRQAVVNSSLLLLVAMLCSLGSGLIKTDGFGEVDYISLVGIIAVAALSFGGIRSFVSEATQTAEEICDFSKMLLPAIAAASAASGNAVSFSAKYAVTTLFMTSTMSVIRSVILPLIYGYLAASIAAAAFGGDGLKGASSIIKWAAVNLLTVTVLAFTVYITISGTVSGAADAAAARLTKTVLSTALPVVGGIISDAAQTVLVGAAALRNAIGLYGLLAVLAICLAPFLRLGINYLIYKGAAMLASTVSSGEVGKVIGTIGSAIGILLGACGSCGLMLFFSILSAIKAVGTL